jgi:hypothetical protein
LQTFMAMWFSLLDCREERLYALGENGRHPPNLAKRSAVDHDPTTVVESWLGKDVGVRKRKVCTCYYGEFNDKNGVYKKRSTVCCAVGSDPTGAGVCAANGCDVC